LLFLFFFFLNQVHICVFCLFGCLCVVFILVVVLLILWSRYLPRFIVN
jgi:hypothetical protein